MDKLKRFTVSIPQEYYQKLVYAAEQKTRSIPREAGYILKMYLKNVEIPDEHLAKIYDFTDYRIPRHIIISSL